MHEVSTILSGKLWCSTNITFPLFVAKHSLLPLLLRSVWEFTVRLPLPGGREVPGSLSVLSPFLQFSNLEFLDPYLDTQPKLQWTQAIWGALFKKKDFKVTNTKSSAKMGKEKALEKINMFNIWYVAQFSENSENSITFLNYLRFLNSFWSYMI